MQWYQEHYLKSTERKNNLKTETTASTRSVYYSFFGLSFDTSPSHWHKSLGSGSDGSMVMQPPFTRFPTTSGIAQSIHVVLVVLRIADTIETDHNSACFTQRKVM